MKSTSLRTALAGLLLASTCLVNVANAALIDRGNGMIYDSTQNITWLQDANYAFTSGYHGITKTSWGDEDEGDGRMPWDASRGWASRLTVGGFTDWRLFNADPADTNCVDNFNPGGGFSQQYYGYNCTNNELGHLFYNEFGLSAGQNVASLRGGNNASFNLFTNVQAYIYWSGTEYEPDTETEVAWGFYTARGYQYNYNDYLFRDGFAWAVRDGDVAAVPEPVPEPGAFAMLGLGLLGLAIRRRLARNAGK